MFKHVHVRSIFTAIYRLVLLFAVCRYLKVVANKQKLFLFSAWPYVIPLGRLYSYERDARIHFESAWL